MRALRTALALGVASACGIACFVGLDGAAQNVKASDVTSAYLDSTVLATLNEETQDGFNPTTNGLYINWGSVDPTQVNFTDHVLTRHDALTDLRDLENMERYEQVNPGDTSQRAAIQRMYPIVATEFKGSTSNVGWVYWDMLDLSSVTGDSQWVADAQSMATAFSKAINPTTGVPDQTLTDNGANCSDGYRVDATLERALMLVDAGKRFADPTWSQQGLRTYSVVRSTAFDPTYGLYDREVCKGVISDPQAKTEEQADEARDGILAGEYAGDQQLVDDGIALLDTLVANRSGLHDTVDGGWCPLFNLSTRTLSCGTKLSRQYLLLRAFHDADQLDPGRYTAEETELENLVPSMVTSPHVGFLYERTRTFGILNGENWISSEADGIVADALLTVLEDGGTTSTTTTSTSTTSTSSTTTTTRTTSTTSSTATSRSSSSSTRHGHHH